MNNTSVLHQALLSLHLIGIAFGLGGAAVSDYSFFKCLRMSDRLTPEVVNWMRSFSQVVWAGIGILAVSGIGLFLLDPGTYLHSSGFIAKMVFVAILITNGLFLNFYTTAKLTTFNFSDNYQVRGSTWWARKLSFTFGAVSTLTWYSILFVALFKSLLHVPVFGYLGIYVVLLAGAIGGSLFLEGLLKKHLKPKPIPSDLNKQTISTIASTASAAEYLRLLKPTTPVMPALQAVPVAAVKNTTITPPVEQASQTMRPAVQNSPTISLR